jgi:putative Mn2+ efflux pump MntP
MYEYSYLLLIAAVASADAAVLSYLFGGCSERFSLSVAICIPGRFAVSHALLAFFGFEMATPVQSWLSRNYLWMLSGLLLFAGFRAGQCLPVSAASPGEKKTVPLTESGSMLDLIALATGIDSLLVGVGAVTAKVPVTVAIAAAGGIVFVVSNVAYISGRLMSGNTVADDSA